MKKERAVTKPNVPAGNMTLLTRQSLGRPVAGTAMEEKLREVEATEQAYQRWRSQQSLDLSEADREALLAMGEDMRKSGMPRPHGADANRCCASSYVT